MDVGFLGLGRMGRAMAANLVAAGHRVRVWNRSPDIAREIQGAIPVATPAEAFAGDAAITMLADDAALRAVFFENGLLDAQDRPAVHLSMSTISVALAKDLAALHERANIAYVAAPVFGRPDAAAKAALNIIVAGDDGVIAKVQPLLDAMGTKTWPFGAEPSRANAVKLAGNFMIIAAIEAMGEAAAFAEGHGVKGAALLDMVTNTLFASPVYKGYGSQIAAGAYDNPGFLLKLGLKDIRLALEASEKAGVPMPFRQRAARQLPRCDQPRRRRKGPRRFGDGGGTAQRTGLDFRPSPSPSGILAATYSAGCMLAIRLRSSHSDRAQIASPPSARATPTQPVAGRP